MRAVTSSRSKSVRPQDGHEMNSVRVVRWRAPWSAREPRSRAEAASPKPARGTAAPARGRRAELEAGAEPRLLVAGAHRPAVAQHDGRLARALRAQAGRG